jgi:hypothetical protein
MSTSAAAGVGRAAWPIRAVWLAGHADRRVAGFRLRHPAQHAAAATKFEWWMETMTPCAKHHDGTLRPGHVATAKLTGGRTSCDPGNASSTALYDNVAGDGPPLVTCSRFRGGLAVVASNAVVGDRREPAQRSVPSPRAREKRAMFGGRARRRRAKSLAAPCRRAPAAIASAVQHTRALAPRRWHAPTARRAR